MNSSGPPRPNPFPGLRPFRSDEHHLFFGREEQTAALLQLLRKNRFLAVVGTSGSGKSSLVRAGLIAELYGGTMTHAGSTWEVIILRPGGSPIENLAKAMVEADLYDAEDTSTLARLKATLSRSRFGLVEAMKQSEVFEPGTNLLVVVDQFEELFRFRQQGVDSEEAATAFVNLLLTASEQAECPIYIAITMRSDYLGDCSEIPGLAEAVNEGEYLIPRLLRDQKRDAIEKPIGVGGAKISPLLVQRLLNDVGDDPDQLPVLQHALMRMWDVWAAGNDHDRPLEVSDFEATGGLAAALSNHADELFSSLPDDRHRRACEKIFKALTEKGDDNRGIRRPTRLAALQAIAGADRETVTTVLDAFRQPGVTFLMPGMETELGDRTVIDLSHESLMRGWQRLRGWVEEEAQSARIFRRLLDTARLWSDGKAGLFRDPDLQIALSWRDEEHPNAEWAEEYGGDFDTAFGFLERSEQAVQAELQAKEDARQRELEQAQQLAEARQQRLEHQQRAARKLRSMLAGLAAVAVVAIVACFAALAANNKANELAKIAGREAENAKMNADLANREREAVKQEQQRTQTALTEVELQKEKVDGEKSRAEQLLQKSILAEQAALEAEQRSREFRYATDIQLAVTLVEDATANAGQVLARLSDHDPEENTELVGKEDLRGFEWHYLKQLAGGRATVFKGFDKDIIDLAVSSDGELVTLSADSRLQRWNAATRQETRPAIDLKQGRTIGAQALSRDGRLAAFAVGSQVFVVDAVTGQEQARSIPAQTRGGLVFSPDGRMLITVDTGVGWWDAATGRPLAVQDFQLTVFSTADYLQPLSVSADGLTLAVGGQGSYRGAFTVLRMNPQTRDVTVLVNAVGDSGTKRTLAISPDGQTVAVSLFFQGAFSLYEVATGKLLHRESAAHSASISSIAFNAEGTELATASLDGTIKVWKDVKTLKADEAISLMGHAGQVAAVTYVPGQRRLLSAGKDKSVRLWDLKQSSSSLHRVIAGSGGVRADYSPDGTLMAIAGEPRLQLRDGTTGQVLLQLPPRGDGLSSDSVAFSPDGRLLAAGFGGKKDVSLIELWDIDRRERLAELPGTTAIPGFATTENTGIVGTVAFSPDGRHLVAGFGSLNLLSWGDRGEFPLLVYDVAARRVLRTLEGHRNTCVSLTFSPDGSRMASASMDGTARTWDVATWKELQVLQNPDTPTDLGNGRVYDVAFSPNGKLLAMASAEGHVILWDAETGRPLQTLEGHANEVWAVAFSPNGLTLASGSIDNTVRLWNVATWRELVRLDPKELLDVRSLTFSPDGNRLLSAGLRGSALVWSVQPQGERSGPTTSHLAGWLNSGVDFPSRVQMYSENLRLWESLEPLAQQFADHATVQAALAATRANWHASRQEWSPAAEQFDRLRQFSPTAPEAWLQTPGHLRLATALLHQDRPVEAAALLTGGEKGRANDRFGTRVVAFGFEYLTDQMPLKLFRVYRGSPAWQAGLRAGDQLLKFNDVDLTARTVADYVKAATGGVGTRLKLTIQRPGQESPETVELTKARHLQNDALVEQMDSLFALVREKLAGSPNHPGLLELRAELAGLSSQEDQQLADYTAAIAALEATDPPPPTALQRLYCRRGDVSVRLKHWQAAYDDYARGITAETRDEGWLANQALAQAETVLLKHHTVLKPVELTSRGGATLTVQDDGSILASGTNPPEDVYTVIVRPGLTRIASLILEALPHPSLPSGGPGRSGGEGNFHLNEVVVFSGGHRVPLSDIVVSFDQGHGRGFRSAIDGKLDEEVGWSIYGRQGQAHSAVISLALERAPDEELKLELHFSRAEYKHHNLGSFRLSASEYAASLDSSGEILPFQQLTDPWQKLAAAFRLSDDQQAIDRLVEQRPQAAGLIGDVFIQGATRDWQRAVDMYSRAITPDTIDADLLTRRARAFEELKDYSAAAADWNRAVGETSERVPLLTEFASRLLKAEQQELAIEQRQRARQILEATLQAHPGDNSATERLAELLLDLSKPQEPEWTVLKPDVSTTAGGATLARLADDALVVVPKPESVTLSVPGRSLSAILIETSPDETPPVASAAPFTEHRLISTRLPADGLLGRYVRIDLPGDNPQYPRFDFGRDGKMLNLAEVQVFQGENNIAQGKAARQSGFYQDAFGDWTADRAVDGNTNGTPEGRSMAHTADYQHPWWEVDLGDDQLIDRLVIWNRTDTSDFSSRMNHFRVRILDASRHILYEEVIDPAPSPSREIRPSQVQVRKLPPDAADDQGLWQLTFESQNGPRPWKRFRLSGTEKTPAQSEDLDSSHLTWSVLKPSMLTPAADTTLAAQADGSFVAETTPSGELTLPPWPKSTQAVRIERASASPTGSTGAAAFSEYRLQAVDTPTATPAAPRGRYVRVDLPGDSQKFPRRLLATAAKFKVLSLAEVQVFQGNENVALAGTARQSSDYESNTAGKATAERAVDGNTDGQYVNRSVTHTAQRTNHDPWWEVDLGGEKTIDRIVLWNRTDRLGIENLAERLNHFRVRILDRSHRVIFEQLIDEAPSPSREIDCRSWLIAKTPESDGDQPRWSLRLHGAAGFDLGGRFRISTAEAVGSLEQEDAHADVRKISHTVARLASAYDLGGQSKAAADWFARALDNATSDPARKAILAPLQSHRGALTELLTRRPDDRDLQLTLARNHVDEGRKHLSRRQPALALTDFQQASAIFTRLLAQHPEPEWTVLIPTDLTSAGGATLTLKPDGSILASGANPDEDTYTIIVPATLDRVTAFRLEALPDPSLPKRGPGRFAGNGNFHLSEIRIHAGASPVALTRIGVSFGETEGYRHIIDGVVDSANVWSNHPKAGQANTAVLAVGDIVPGAGPWKFELLTSRGKYKQHGLGRFRLSAIRDPQAFEAAQWRNAIQPAELAALDVAIGQAFAQQGQAAEAASAFARALDHVETVEARKPLIEQLQEHQEVLAVLAEQRPREFPLQLALAKRLAESGKQALAEKRQDEALPQLDKARELFSRLAAEHPESTWTVLQPTEMTSEGGTVLTRMADGSILASGPNPSQETYTLSALLNISEITALRLEALPDPSLPQGGSGRDSNGSFNLSGVTISLGQAGEQTSEPLTPLLISKAFASYHQSTSSIELAIDANPDTYWQVWPEVKVPQWAIFEVERLPEPVAGRTLVVRLTSRNGSLGRLRLSVTGDTDVLQVVQFHQDLKASGLADLERSLGNAHARRGRTEQAAVAYQQALDLAADRDARLTILQEASAHAGVLNKLVELHPANATFLDVLARQFQRSGDLPGARAAAAQARALYEQQLTAEPANAKLARDLADLLLDVGPTDWAMRNWTILKPTEMKSETGATLTLLEDGSLLAGGTAANNDVYTVTTKAGLSGIQAFLLEAIPHESLPLGASGRRPHDGNFALTEFKIAASDDGRPGSFIAVPLTLAICDYSQPHSPVMNVLDGKDDTFWDILPHIHQPHYAAFLPAATLTTPADGVLTFTLEFKYGQPLGLGRFRLSATDNAHAFTAEKARLLAQKIEDPWLRLGVAYHSLGQFDQALDAAARAFERAGSDPAKAVAAQQAAAFDDLFARLLDRFPNDKALRVGQAKYQASQHIAEARFQDAVDLLSDIIADFPDDLELRNLRATASMKLAQWQSADADFARIIELETDAGRRRTAERTRAQVQLRLGQFQQGAEAFLQEMLLTPDYYRARDASVAQMLAGNSGAARTAAQRLYEKFSSTKNDSEARWQIHVFTCQPGLVTKDNSQKLLELAKTAGGTWTEPMTAAIHYRLGDLAKAEALLTTTRSEQEILALRAMLLYDRGEIDRARSALSAATNWFQGERAKDPDSAIPSSQQDFQLWSVRLTVWREAARKLIGPRLTELDELLANEPDRTPERLERAGLLADAGLHDEALQDLDRLVALQGHSPATEGLHGRVLIGMNRAEEALPRLNAAIDAGSQEAGVHVARATILLKRGQTAEARADLERSLDLEPNDLAARLLADLLLAEAEKATRWTVLQPVNLKSERGATLTPLDDGSVLASGINALGDVYSATAIASLDRITAVRLEALPDPNLPSRGPGRHSSGNFQLSAIRPYYPATAGDSEALPLTWASATASFDFKADNADVAGLVDHRLNKVWHVWGRTGAAHQVVLRVQEPPVVDLGRSIVIELHHRQDGEAVNLGRFRLSISDDPLAFEREQSRLAAERLTNPAARLDAAYRVSGQGASATASYHRLIELRRSQGASPEQLAQAFRLRGAHYVRIGEWKLAAADYAESVSLDSKSNSVDWMTPAALWAYAADLEQHRLYCQKMASKFGQSTVANDVERTVKVSVLLDQSALPDQALVGTFVEAVAKTADPGSLKWYLSAKALLACRNDDHNAAQDSVQEALRLVHAAGDAPDSMPGLMARSVQALILARQGDATRARVALDELKTLMATDAKLKWQDDGTLDGVTLLNGERVQHDWLIPEILRREAHRLLKTQDRASDDQR
jgi:WD40 repeat protein/tetratricopeptide (TPR) repeat protein/energy-coupling factor transporter ATP-binding protein EcfA2